MTERDNAAAPPPWLDAMHIGRWYRLSGDAPDLGLAHTAVGTRYLEDGDPALNPSRGLEMHLRRLAGRTVKAPWSGRGDFCSITEGWNGAVFADRNGASGSMIVFGGGTMITSDRMCMPSTSPPANGRG